MCTILKINANRLIVTWMAISLPATAGRGWATKADVLNTLSAAKIKSWAAGKRKG
jgi:hypothetical protein